MSNAVVSLMFAAGASAWIYTKFMRYNGNDQKTAAIGTTIAGLIIFFIFFSILSLILK